MFISQDVKIYIVDLIRRTRESDMVYLGASPRTTAKYLKAVRANALINGRNYVIPEDIVSTSLFILLKVWKIEKSPFGLISDMVCSNFLIGS